MTREELDNLTKIRDDAKGSFWDFEKWRVMARLDQFIADAQHEHQQNAAAYDALKANAPDGFDAGLASAGRERSDRVGEP